MPRVNLTLLFGAARPAAKRSEALGSDEVLKKVKWFAAAFPSRQDRLG